MRLLPTAAVLSVCLLPSLVLAEEGADALTAQLPRECQFIVRLPSLERVDALGKEALPFLTMFGEEEIARLLESAPASGVLLAKLGMDPALVDRTKPVYVGAVEGHPVVVAAAAEGAVLEAPKVLPGGMVASLAEGVLRVAPAGLETGEPRGTPTDMLAGDVAVHVFLQEIVDEHKQSIEAGLAQAGQAAAAVPTIPEGFRGFVPTIMDAARGGIYGVQGFDYGLTWKGETVLTEGRLTTRARTGLRTLFLRAGAPAQNSLARFLPEDAMFVIDLSLPPDWPNREIADFLSKSMGEGAGEAVLALFGAAQGFTDALAGHTAASVKMAGMMAGTSTSIMRLKGGTDPKALFESYSTEKMNAAFTKLGVDMAMKFEKGVARHGDVELHRLTMSSSDPMFAMMAAMQQTYMAATDGYLLVVQSMAAEQDLRDFIDKVKAGGAGKHAHLDAMDRLGRSHHVGFSFNVGQLKQMAFMFGMMGVPELVQTLANLPDRLYISSAISFSEGDLHWRGEWPVKKLAEVAAGVAAAAEEGEKPPPPDEDFD